MVDVVVVHQRTWLGYWRGIDSAIDAPQDPQASALRGFLKWVLGVFYRAYAAGNRVITSPWCPPQLLAHEIAHTPALGRELPTLVAPRDLDGGLGHEPWHTFDIMLPGYLSPLRRRDARRIRARCEVWLEEGRILLSA